MAVTVVAAILWGAWYALAEDRQISSSVARAAQGVALVHAREALTSEAGLLAALQLFDAVPPGITPASPRPNVAETRAALFAADRAGVAALAELRTSGFVVVPQMAAVLGPLPSDLGNDVGDGRIVAVASAPYAQTLALLTEVSPTAEVAGEAATIDLAERRQGTDALSSWSWMLPAAALALFAAWCLARLAAALPRGGAGSEAGEVLRADQMAALLAAARRLSAERELSSMMERVALEARTLLDADFAVFFRVESGRAIPVSSVGIDELQPVPSGIGTAGMVMLSAETTWAPIRREDGFANFLGGQVLITPLVNDRRVDAMVAAGRAPGRSFIEDDGSVLQLLGQAAVPIFENLQLHEAAADLVNVDALTGLANRRRLDGDLGTTLHQIMADGESVAFCMVDVDHFKKFNDSFGHPAGDALLRQVAVAISAAVRHRDVVYRYGGEEFCVLLPGASPSEARMVAERVRWAVENRQMVDEHGCVVGRVTVSVGVSCRSDLDTAALVSDADAALYRAKQAGRNRIAIAE